MSRLNNNVLAIAEQLKQTISAADGKFVIPDNAFESTLPPEMTLDQVKAMQQQINHFAAGAQYAAGQVGIEYMKANPDCGQLSGVVQMGQDKLTMNFDRTKTIPADLNGGTKQVYGNMAVFHTIAGGAQQKHVRSSLREMAHGVLGS